MKKLLAVLILLSAVSYAGEFSPIYISSSGTKSGTPNILLNGFPEKRGAVNCITDVSMSADNFLPAGYTLTVLDGGTTAYSLSQSTQALVESWSDNNPLCLSPNTTTYISVSGGNFKVNVSGYEKPR